MCLPTRIFTIKLIMCFMLITDLRLPVLLKFRCVHYLQK